MSRPLLRAGFLACLIAIGATSALAKSHTIPDPNPVAVITVPDEWETKAIPGGIEITTEDEEYYLAIEVTTAKAAEKDISSALRWLISKGVKIDEASAKESTFKLNGMDGFIIYWNATDEDGPTQVSIAFLAVNETKMLLVTGWGTEEAQKENAKELLAMLESLRAIK